MKKKLLTILLACALSVSVFACGNNNSENNDNPKSPEETRDTSTSPETNSRNELDEVANEKTPEEAKTFDGLIDFLVSKGYITKEGDGGSFAEALGAINGYRYYNLETLETTEIYEFSPKKDMSNLSLSGMEVTPDKIIGTYAIFSENEELIKDVEEYLK